ncbi:MAG TPA: site-specific integrase, partial [Solirubrobacteraceae bacterium]|nr:site-specific integrase [Solirubrobacteraceae bacterium]
TDRHGKESVRWFVVLDLGFGDDGRRRQKWHGGFGTRREAEAARAQLVNEINNGAYVVPGRTTLAEWIRESWLPMTEPRIKPTTFHSYKRNLELHVIPMLGQKRLQQLTPPMLTGLYGRLAQDREDRKGLSAKTISYIHSTLHKVLSDAVDAGLLAKNVAASAKPPRPHRRATRGIQAWEPDELARFLDTVRGTRLEAIWRLSAMTGMRRGEILGVRWQDIDLDRARLSVRQALVAVGYEIVHSTPKSHSARVIDLDSETVAQLRAHRQRQNEERAEWGPDYEERDLVVAKENGEPIHPHTFSQSFERLLEKHGLRRIRLHDLRHTHATLALKAGVPVKVISERLGHESPAFTLKQYAHVIPGMQAEAAAQVAAMIDGPPRSV